MKIPIGIFFGGATSARDQSLQTAQRVFQVLDRHRFTPLAFFVDPFGQLIFLEAGIPVGENTSEFYPSEQYFSAKERVQFAVYPEQLGELGISERLAMAKSTGKLVGFSDLPQYISIAFLALPDVQALQQSLHVLRIPHTGELADFSELCADRFGLRLQLQKLDFELPATLRLTATEWQENSLQAIWGEDSDNVAYPLLLRPGHQYSTGRSTVVLAKDGPEGLRRAIDLAFGQKRLRVEDWLDMSPVDRENFVRRLAQWSSGIGFPLELNTGKETILFQRPQSLLDYLQQIGAESAKKTLLFRARKSEDEILVASLPEGTAFSCVLVRREDQHWQAVDLRFLGGAQAIVAGTEVNPVQAGQNSKISESLQQQLLEACRRLADGLKTQAGIRIFGVLSVEGQLIPEEVQPFLGPNKGEKIEPDALKSFIITSLKARQAQKPDPVYRSILETLTDPDGLVAEEESLAEIPHEEDLVEESLVVETAAIPTPLKSVPQQTTVHQTIYEREVEKLKKEKAAMPETITLLKNNPREEGPGPKRKERLWPNAKLFFKSRLFWRNVGAIAAFLLLFFLLVNMTLRLYTKHGDSMQLEDYQGLLLEDAQRKAEAKGLKMEVISTSFQQGKRPNEIFAQYPEALSKVKENRTIFVSVYQNQGTEIVLPAFTDVGDEFENYRRELRKRKINLVIKDQVFNGKLGEGTILYLIINGQKITNTELKEDDVKVEQGATVEAVISTRTSNTVDLPNLMCLSFSEASFNLTGSQLVVGKVYGGSGGDRNNMYVWKQEPEYVPGKLVDKGAQVNIYLTATKPDNCP